jgi:hypothetical protein
MVRVLFVAGLIALAGAASFGYFGVLGRNLPPPDPGRAGFPVERQKGMIRMSPVFLRWTKRFAGIGLLLLAVAAAIALFS